VKVVYLTWGETPRSYGVYGAQVLGQYVATHSLSMDDEFEFIAAVPVIHSGLARERFEYSEELQRVKKKLENIKLHWLPIFAPQNIVNSNQYTFHLFHIFSDYILFLKLRSLKPDIVHCRSYHAGWSAMQVKAKYGMQYKIIFDARGIWPEEVALKKGWGNTNRHYQFLKAVQKQIVENSDLTIVVSEPMKRYFRQLYSSPVKTVYLSAPTKSLRPMKDLKRTGDGVVFCYLGALARDTWHKPDELFRLYKHLKSVVPNSKLVIITTSDHNAIRESFSGILEKDVLITQTKTVDELQALLSQADIGLMAYFNPKSVREICLAKSVLAVKTAEYLSAELPILVNSFCGGAAEVVEKNEVGIAYNPNNFEELTSESILPLLDSVVKKRAGSVASEFFDYRQNAKKYIEIYKELV